jgi:hypothetical protein
VVSDLLGTSARRMLHAVGNGETDPTALAGLADSRLRATPDQLRDAFGAYADLHPVYRRLVNLTLDEFGLIEDQLAQLDQQMADLLTAHHDAVQRLAEVPGLGVDSAQQIIAEVGASAAAFPSAKQLASWMGACPGNEESAGVNCSHRCPKGNRQMRRVLNQAANAAVKAKGSIFAIVYRRLVWRLGARASHRGDRPPPLSSDLEDSAPGRAVRGARAGRRRRGEEGASAQDDPRTPESRLSGLTGLTRADGLSDSRPWLIREAA